MSNYDLEKVLPHNAPMILIDDVVEYDLEKLELTAKVTIHEDKLFFDKSINGISSFVGIEYMAQTIGCYSYFRNQCNPPQIGFLLGSRLYSTSISKFENGETYTIKVHEIFTDNQIVAFDCIIYNESGEEISSATINAFQGENAEELLING